MIKCIEEMENDIKVLKDCIRLIAKEFVLNPRPEVIYSVDPTQNIYAQFMDNLFDKIVVEDVLSIQLEMIKKYVTDKDALTDLILQKNYNLQQANIDLKEKYEELENKYKTMERNFYDAFS